MQQKQRRQEKSEAMLASTTTRKWATGLLLMVAAMAMISDLTALYHFPFNNDYDVIDVAIEEHVKDDMQSEQPKENGTCGAWPRGPTT